MTESATTSTAVSLAVRQKASASSTGSVVPNGAVAHAASLAPVGSGGSPRALVAPPLDPVGIRWVAVLTNACDAAFPDAVARGLGGLLEDTKAIGNTPSLGAVNMGLRVARLVETVERNASPEAKAQLNELCGTYGRDAVRPSVHSSPGLDTRWSELKEIQDSPAYKQPAAVAECRLLLSALLRLQTLTFRMAAAQQGGKDGVPAVDAGYLELLDYLLDNWNGALRPGDGPPSTPHRPPGAPRCTDGSTCPPRCGADGSTFATLP